MDILGIIPARGGSKGIPRKNLMPLLGKPLLAYTCEAAKQSKRLTRTIVSTDDEDIARVARDCGMEVPFLRPGELSEDATPMLEVVQHTLAALRERERYTPEILVLLQPTSPLRNADHIDATIDLFRSKETDTVVSVMKVPHNFTPASLMRLQDDALVPYFSGQPILQRQGKERLYARNGPAVLACRSRLLLGGRGFYDGVTRPYLMDRRSSLDIDTQDDLKEAAWLLQEQGEKLR